VIHPRLAREQEREREGVTESMLSLLKAGGVSDQAAAWDARP
jgi:hypothetical protein